MNEETLAHWGLPKKKNLNMDIKWPLSSSTTSLMHLVAELIVTEVFLLSLFLVQEKLIKDKII